MVYTLLEPSCSCSLVQWELTFTVYTVVWMQPDLHDNIWVYRGFLFLVTGSLYNGKHNMWFPDTGINALLWHPGNTIECMYTHACFDSLCTAQLPYSCKNGGSCVSGLYMYLFHGGRRHWEDVWKPGMVDNCVGQRCENKGFCINACPWTASHGLVCQQLSLSEWRDMCWLWWWLILTVSSIRSYLTAYLQTVQVGIQMSGDPYWNSTATLCNLLASVPCIVHH